MSTIADLQKEVNRFSNDPDIGFAPIACDGVAGPNTLSATIWALTSINLADDTVDDTWKQSAGVLIDTMSSPSDLTAQLDSLMAVIQGGASQLGRQYTTCPQIASTPKAVVAVMPPTTPKAIAAAQRVSASPAASSNFGAGLLGLGLPNWAVYTGGTAIALGIIASIVHHVRTKRAA